MNIHSLQFVGHFQQKDQFLVPDGQTNGPVSHPTDSAPKDFFLWQDIPVINKVPCHEDISGGVEVYIHAFLASVLDEGK